jgi:hypothetical protein
MSVLRVMRNLVGVLTGFCFALTASGSTPAQVEVRSGALQLTLAVSRTAYCVGEEIPLVLSLRNLSEAAAFIQSFTPRLFDFSVYDASGAVVRRPTVAGKPIMAPPLARMLRPGQTITRTMTWEPWVLDSTGGRGPVPPGSYAVEGYAVWDRSGNPLLRTPRLSIEIRSRPCGAGDNLRSERGRSKNVQRVAVGTIATVRSSAVRNM